MRPAPAASGTRIAPGRTMAACRPGAAPPEAPKSASVTGKAGGTLPTCLLGSLSLTGEYLFALTSKAGLFALAGGWLDVMWPARPKLASAEIGPIMNKLGFSITRKPGRGDPSGGMLAVPVWPAPIGGGAERGSGEGMRGSVPTRIAAAAVVVVARQLNARLALRDWLEVKVRCRSTIDDNGHAAESLIGPCPVPATMTAAPRWQQAALITKEALAAGTRASPALGAQQARGRPPGRKPVRPRRSRAAGRHRRAQRGLLGGAGSTPGWASISRRAPATHRASGSSPVHLRCSLSLPSTGQRSAERKSKQQVGLCEKPPSPPPPILRPEKC